MSGPISDVSPQRPWYETLTDVVFQTPENNTKVIRTAIEAIKKGESSYPEMGLTSKTQEALKELSDRMKLLEPEEKKVVNEYMDEKLKQLSAAVFKRVSDSKDALNHIVGFSESWKETSSLSLVSKDFTQAVKQAVPERQVASILKGEKPADTVIGKAAHFVKQLFNKKTLPSLSLPSNYSFENKPFSEFSKLLPPEFNLEKGLAKLMSQASAIKPGSPEEKLALYLMKHVAWDAKAASQLPWPKNSNVKLVAEDALRVLGDKEPLGAFSTGGNKWEIAHYGGAYVQDPNNSIYYKIYELIEEKKTPYNENPSLCLVYLQGGGKLSHLSSELQDNKEFVLNVVKNVNPSHLEGCVEKFKKDEDIVLAAIEKKPTFIKFADEELRNKEAFGLKALAKSVDVLPYLSPELHNNKKIILAALSHGKAKILHYVGFPRHGWKESKIDEFISNDLKKDREVALALIKVDPSAFTRMGKDLQNNENFVVEAIKLNPAVWTHISKPVFRASELVARAVLEGEPNKIKRQQILANFSYHLQLYLADYPPNVQDA